MEVGLGTSFIKWERSIKAKHARGIWIISDQAIRINLESNEINYVKLLET